MEPNTSTTAKEQSSTTPSRRAPSYLAIWRRRLIVLTGLATIVAIFYAVEDWRGKNEWQKCKARLEAQGQVLDWNAVVPPPVPDDQNFFKAPHIAEWFVGRGNTELSRRLPLVPNRTNSPTLAEIILVPPTENAQVAPGDILVRAGDPSAIAATDMFLDHLLGPAATGDYRQWTIVASFPNVPGRIFVATSNTNGAALTKLFKVDTTYYVANTNKPIPGVEFKIVSVGINKFHLLPNVLYTASEYLAASDDASDFADIRDALKRPYARIDGDYLHPAEMPIPNYVTFRSVSQILIARAQCYFLLNEPEKALDQLTMVHNLCRVLEMQPSNKPMILVTAMINVAIRGIYTKAAAEGVFKHTWREPQLRAVQEQLHDVDLLPFARAGLETERAAVLRLFGDLSQREFANLFADHTRSSTMKNPPFAKWFNQFYLETRLCPHGWFYQNMVTSAMLMQPVLDAIDLTDSKLSPHIADAASVLPTFNHPSRTNFLATIAIPNFTRTLQTTAQNQTDVNLTYLACALERYHLVHHEYPETLNEVVPQFADHLPHDIINGQPLHYHRTDDGQFKLYSVGWNEKDDNGTPGDNQSGDWVWQYPLQ